MLVEFHSANIYRAALSVDPTRYAGNREDAGYRAVQLREKPQFASNIPPAQPLAYNSGVQFVRAYPEAGILSQFVPQNRDNSDLGVSAGAAG